MRYVLLIYGQGGSLSAEAEELALSRHRELQAAAGDDLVAVAKLATDEPRFPAVVGKTARHEVMDGPYGETKEWLVGFYLLDCESEAQALERAASICCVDSHRIEVRPVSWSRP